MSSQFFGSEVKHIDIALILMRMVPHRTFTEQIALYCAGMDWDYIVQSYSYPRSLLQQTFQSKLQLVEQAYGSKESLSFFQLKQKV